MAYVPDPVTVEISRSMLEHLKERPGRVNGMFVARVAHRHRPEDVFTAMHVLNTLLTGDFKFSVRQESEAQVMVKCSNPDDIMKLEAAVSRIYKFGEHWVKFRHIGRLELMPYEDDTLYRNGNVEYFPAEYESRSVEASRDVGYPTGYFDTLENVDVHKNPRLSVTTMSLLGLADGHTEGLLKVNIKHMLTPEEFQHIYHTVPWKSRYKSAIDEDGYMYLKFDVASRAQFLARTNFYIDRYMIKFYSADSVARKSVHFDKARLSPVYSRARNADEWELVEV